MCQKRKNVDHSNVKSVKTQFEDIYNKIQQYVKLQRESKQSDQNMKAYSDFMARESTDLSTNVSSGYKSKSLYVKKCNQSSIQQYNDEQNSWILSTEEMRTLEFKNEDQNFVALQTEISKNEMISEMKEKSKKSLQDLQNFMNEKFGERKLSIVFIFFLIQYFITIYLFVFLSLKFQDMKKWDTYVSHCEQDRKYFVLRSKDIKDIDLKQCQYESFGCQKTTAAEMEKRESGITEDKSMIIVILVLFLIFKVPYLLFKTRLVITMFWKKRRLDVFTMFDSKILDYLNINIDIALVIGFSPLFNLQFIETGCLNMDFGYQVPWLNFKTVYFFMALVGIAVFYINLQLQFISSEEITNLNEKPIYFCLLLFQFIQIKKLFVKCCIEPQKWDIFYGFLTFLIGPFSQLILLAFVLQFFSLPFLFYFSPIGYRIYWYIYIGSTIICIYICKDGKSLQKQIEYMKIMADKIGEVEYLEEQWGASVQKIIILRNSQNWTSSNYSINLYTHQKQNLSQASLYSISNSLKSNVLQVCVDVKNETQLLFTDEQPQINKQSSSQYFELTKTKSDLPLLNYNSLSTKIDSNDVENQIEKQIMKSTQINLKIIEEEERENIQDNQIRGSFKQIISQTKEINVEEINFELNIKSEKNDEIISKVVNESNDHKIRGSFNFLD